MDEIKATKQEVKQDVLNRFEHLLKRWEQVEGAIKSAELVHHSVSIPAINELRYAGRQLISAISIAWKTNPDWLPPTEGSERILRALSNAEQYLINADNDVVDSVVHYISRRLDELNFKYGKASIATQAPGYEDLCDIRNQCVALIRESRRDTSKRLLNYDKMRDGYLAKLVDYYNNLTEADTIMSVQQARISLKLKYERRKNSLLLGALALSAGGWVALLSLFGWLISK